MNKICVSPGLLHGQVSVPPSKSAVHRAIICAALAGGVSTIAPVELSNDISATISCIKALGAKASLSGKVLTVDGNGIFQQENALLDCGESGSTLRFLIPAAAAGGVHTRFVGHGRLPERPIGVLTECLPLHGVACYTGGGLPLEIEGQLQGGTFLVPGNISSQFITGLLLALPLLQEDSDILLTTPAQSTGYIDMTLDVIRRFGVTIEPTEKGWHIPGGQHYQPCRFTVEGDWSQAAFFMTAAALGGDITIDNLDIGSFQGDKACIELYRQFGASVSTLPDGRVRISGNDLHGIDIQAENIPDMVPALAVTAALCQGTTVISGAQRLRIKECDRLAAICDGLSRLGADIHQTEDGLIIHGVPQLHGGEVNGYNDHRIVMALATASARCSGDIVISDKESINKSYPSFFEDFTQLGGNCHVIMG